MKLWVGVTGAIVFCVGIVLAAGVLRQQADKQVVAAPEVTIPDDLEDAPRSIETPTLAEALGVAEKDMIEVGGVERPKRDLVRYQMDQDKERKRYLDSLPQIGKAPSVPKDANAKAKKLAGELNEKGLIGIHPARSPFAGTEPFDLAKYLKDPKSYLDLTRPSRVFQAKPPGKNVVPIESQSPMFLEVLQGDAVMLEVKAEPGMPVTFHTQQLGEFDNRLKTISVAANDDGFAQVKYRAVSGVEGSVRIMAASPAHSGRLTYLVDVSLPN